VAREVDAEALLAGNRRDLARAITLVESSHPDDRARAAALLEAVIPQAGGSVRLGVTGAPGSGKSTLIEALGLQAVEEGRKVAVIAVDPSSALRGGSILGDKTRMSELARHTEAFIRPSPSSGTLGGVAPRTREVLVLCEAAGFDLVIVETVGVGQSEVAVADLVDLFLLVASPAGGDEMQGIKRGIMELADVIAVNKSDGDLLPAAQRAAADLRRAVHLLRPKRDDLTVPVLLTSALSGAGVPELWSEIVGLHEQLRTSGALAALRAEQGTRALRAELRGALEDRFMASPAVRRSLEEVEQRVADGTTDVTAAVELLLARHGSPSGG